MPTTNQYLDLERRVTALEAAINNMITALTKLVTVDQVTRLDLLRQTEVAQHTVQIAGIESRLTSLESYHRT